MGLRFVGLFLHRVDYSSSWLFMCKVSFWGGFDDCFSLHGGKRVVESLNLQVR